MNGPDILAHHRHRLAQFLAERGFPPPAKPLSISPWLAITLLQKAIRRGEQNFALSAAASLLKTSPDRFWKRCGVIAAEDVGVADPDTVALVTSAMAGRSIRSGLGTEWEVASLVVSVMVRASKCRAADDLLRIAETHPAYEQDRLAVTFRPTLDLIRIAIGNADLPVRALALWYAVGTDRCRSHHLRLRGGEPNAVFEQLCEAGFPHTLVEVARENFRRTSEVLAPLLVLLCPSRQEATATEADDDLPPEVMCGKVPSWALDRFSREGRHALTLFLTLDCETTRWLRDHIPPTQRLDFIGGILFRVESGLVRRRMRWPLADELRRLSDIECRGSNCRDANEILGLMRADIPLLNDVRAHVR